jgi:hypothetical protein
MSNRTENVDAKAWFLAQLNNLKDENEARYKNSDINWDAFQATIITLGELRRRIEGG